MLTEKQEKKPTRIQFAADGTELYYQFYCPKCGSTLMVDKKLHPVHLFNYCGACGQPLDWSDLAALKAGGIE